MLGRRLGAASKGADRFGLNGSISEMEIVFVSLHCSPGMAWESGEALGGLMDLSALVL